MRFLAINTAGQLEAVLYIDGESFEFYDTDNKKASEVLLVSIDSLLKKANITLKDLDFLACVIGPGSFTGIRIGVTTIRAMCQSLNKNAVAVTNTHCLSYNHRGANYDDNLSIDLDKRSIVCISDASNGYAYLAIYNSKHECTKEPMAIKIDQIPDFLASIKQQYVIVADNFMNNKLDNAIEAKNNCEALKQAVLDSYKAFGARDYTLLEPLYVRKSQAEVDLENRRKQ